MEGEITCLFIRTGSMALGCRMCLNSFRETLVRITIRIHFKPPVVLPAHRSHQHDDGKQPPQDGCPLHIVICRKTGGGLEGDYLEQGFAEGFFHPHGTGIVKHDGYDGSEEHN